MSETWTGRILGGRYQLGVRLGQGGFGAVFDAIQMDLGRRVVVKVLHPRVARDPQNLWRFEQEARSAAGLGHPNIVQVTDFQRPTGEPAFLVMERLDGYSLAEVLGKDATLSPDRVVFIVRQVLSALEATHGAGIVHRDLKPANIFLTSITGVRDIVKLLDFGLAKLTEGKGSRDNATVAGIVVGTPRFMAPEQLEEVDLDGRTDIFALGVVMYRALAGRCPFDGPNMMAVLKALRTAEPPPVQSLNPSVPPQLAHVVHRAMVLNRDFRFAMSAEMSQALEGVFDPVTPLKDAAEGKDPDTQAAPGQVVLALMGSSVMEQNRQDADIPAVGLDNTGRTPAPWPAEVVVDPGVLDRPGLPPVSARPLGGPPLRDIGSDELLPPTVMDDSSASAQDVVGGRADNIDPGNYKVTFSDLDKDAWEPISAKA